MGNVPLGVTALGAARFCTGVPTLLEALAGFGDASAVLTRLSRAGLGHVGGAKYPCDLRIDAVAWHPRS